MGPASKRGATLAVKYGPHVMKAWDIFGDKAKDIVRSKIDEVGVRNAAFKDAEARVNGSVLRVPQKGQPVFVVFAGDEPVAAYPETDQPLESLIDRIDLTRRITPAQRRERQLRARALRAGDQVAQRAPYRRS
ncbi:MAG: hypothetical protein ACXWDI_11275 [Nocardioides sp.]